MRSWLRRNLVALIVIVLAIPALGFVFLGPPLLDGAGEPQVVIVTQGDSVEAGGYSFTLTASREFPGTGTGNGPDANTIPLGSSLVGALFEVTPTGEATDSTCDVELTSRAGGTDRAWPTVSSPRDFDYGIGEDHTTVCILDGESFELEAVFLTPKGTYDEATIDLSVGTKTFRFTPVR